MLSAFQPQLDLHVATNASRDGLGAVIYQEPARGKRNLIAFAAKALTGSQQNYSATKRELLGIIFALHKFHIWLFGRHFTLWTDHSALTTMQTKSKV